MIKKQQKTTGNRPRDTDLQGLQIREQRIHPEGYCSYASCRLWVGAWPGIGWD